MNPADQHMLLDIESREDKPKFHDFDIGYPSSGEDITASSQSSLVPAQKISCLLHEKPKPVTASSSLRERKNASTTNTSPASLLLEYCSKHKSSATANRFDDNSQLTRFLSNLAHKRNVKKGYSEKESYQSRFGTAQFTATTIFDSPQFRDSDAFGIYVLFWLGTAFVMLRSVVRHYASELKTSFNDWPVVQILLTDIVWVALTDLGMYLSTFVVYFNQYFIRNQVYLWQNTGFMLHALYTAAYFVFWLVFASERFMNFPWIARVFLVLHSLVLVMKMHLYSMYNGYLWNIFAEYEFSVAYLCKKKSQEIDILSKYEHETVSRLLEDHVKFCEFELEHQATAIAVDFEGMDNVPVVPFPKNITVRNFFEYSMFPTVVYSLSFPRTRSIRWGYVIEKVFGIFGIIFLMIVVANRWIYPLVLECLELRNLSARDRIIPFVFILFDIIPAFMMEYLFTFFIIWDAILNAIAELSRFGDREFYGPWWSCTDWLEFSRIWNVPVHKFLLRHVYHSLISTFEISKSTAGLVTFVVLSIVHEIVMYVIYGRLRGYLLMLQLSQLPLIALSRTKILRDRKVLGNFICWFGFISGPGTVCVMYLVF